MCRGLLSGKMSPDSSFSGDDLRNVDPKFSEPRFSQYLEAVKVLQEFSRDRFSKDVIHLSVRFILDKGVDVALWGGRGQNRWMPWMRFSDGNCLMMTCRLLVKY